MATLHKAVFDKNYYTEQELSNLSNLDIISKVKEGEDVQVSAIYTLDEFNAYDEDGCFIDCFVLDVMI